MPLLFQVPAHPPAPAARRRFHIIIGLLTLASVVALVLQYTDHALLPPTKKDTLWGFLVGILGAWIVIEYRWAGAKRRDDTGTQGDA